MQAAPLFTPQNAREMQLRSAQSRKANAIAAEQARQAELAKPQPGTLQDRIQRTERQLDELDQEIEETRSMRDKLALLRLKTELLRGWQLMTSPKRKRGNSGATPVPVPVQSSPK